MQRDAAILAQHEQRASMDDLSAFSAVRAEAEMELPHQKALVSVQQTIGHHKPWLFQRPEHMLEDPPDSLNAPHVIDGILETRIVAIQRLDRTQRHRRQ